MAKIKLTKNELKRQKDDLKRFNRYLPTLLLKKQQLQFEIQAIEAAHREKLSAQKKIEQSILNGSMSSGRRSILETLLN